MPSQSHSDTVQPFIGENETAIAAQSNKEDTFFLTDRRLFSVRTVGKDDERTVVDTLHLDLVSGTKTEHVSKPDIDRESVGYGIAAIFIGFIALLMSSPLDGSTMTLMIAIGIGVGIMGIVLIIEGYSSEDGNVTIKLQNDGGEAIKQIRLGEDQLEFAETLSRVVSGNITPPEDITRKISS